MTSPSQPPSPPPSPKVLLVLVALLAGSSAGLGSYIVARTLDASGLDAIKWAGGTFIAITMLILKIREELR